MITLQEKKMQFNSKLTISNTGGNLSTDSGLILVKEFMESLNFSELSRRFLKIEDDRLYHIHNNLSLMKQLIYQNIAGYSTDSSANLLQQDPIFKEILDKSRLASQSSLSRFWDRISEENISQLQDLNQAMIDKVRLARNVTEMIFDLDSTHSDTYGKQERTDYNAHYQTNGYHPLVAFDGLTGGFLKAELRSGSVYTSTGVGAFMKPLFEHYNQVVPVSNILVRGDSGFATPEVYDLCEAYDSFFVILLKANRNLSKLAESFIQIDDNYPWHKKEIIYSSTFYQAKSWSQKRRVCIKSTREADELLFRHEYIITNYSENTSAETVFQIYCKRGTMENFIKEAKNGFYFDKTDSPLFLENHARMMISLLAYNIVNFMRTLCFTPGTTHMQVSTIRLKLFKVAGKLVRTGRRLLLKFSSHHVHQDLFYQVLGRIQQLSW